MTKKQRRLTVLALVLLGFGTAAALTLAALEDNVAFFYSPSDIAARSAPPSERFRLGGLVARDSVARETGSLRVAFAITDEIETIPVTYTGVLPDLFREGQGVVAEGTMGSDGVFTALEVLAKHDENYMPPEVADALERARAAETLVEPGS